MQTSITVYSRLWGPHGLPTAPITFPFSRYRENDHRLSIDTRVNISLIASSKADSPTDGSAFRYTMMRTRRGICVGISARSTIIDSWELNTNGCLDKPTGDWRNTWN
ncbi:hypothetical protein HZ326_7952 [Fusarium oxysporum f. sp. albedinis]|nr:hypothetical protein HZ326_7952 [Fusarium oxysporum f. sp. albedinis]